MTPIQKAKEIIIAFNKFIDRLPVGSYNDTVDTFLESPSAAALLSGEDWISVKDRLPDIIEHFGLSNEVLAFYEWDKSFDVDMLCKDGTWYSGRTPTHWQPLPKAPQNG